MYPIAMVNYGKIQDYFFLAQKENYWKVIKLLDVSGGQGG